MKILTINIDSLTDEEVKKLLPRGSLKKIAYVCECSASYVGQVYNDFPACGIDAIRKQTDIKKQARVVLREYREKVKQAIA